MVPKPIYELLPYVYMGIGVIGVISLETRWGKLCGVILIGTGIVIQQLRARHRAVERLFHKRNHGSAPSPEPVLAAVEEPRSRRSIPEPRSRRSIPEPQSRRSMPEPRSKRL